jgi:hypothetical protein
VALKSKVPTEEQIKDPRYFIESHFWIVNKDRKKVPFIYNPVQIRYYREHTNADLILKARKEGFSTEIEAEFLHACIFGKNENCVTMSATWPDTVIHMDRIKYFLDTMGFKDYPFTVDRDKENQHELFFPHSNSRYWIGTAGSTTFGRGRDITKLHLSEVAHYSNQDVLTGVLEACTPSARKVLETTANGVGEVFHRLWREAGDPQAGSPWKRHFFAWFEDPTNSMSVPYGVTFRMTDPEECMKAQYKLTNEQVYWYRMKRNSMTDKALMAQEHPANDQEAFLSSGRHAFTLTKIQEKKNRTHPPQRICEIYDDGKQVSVRDEEDGRFQIWKMPRQGRRYLISADVSEGIPGGDYCRMDVLDRSSWEQVATWRGYMDPGDFGRHLVSAGYFYENAVVVPELNNHGWGCVEAIKGEKYPHLLKTTILWKDEPEKEGFPSNEKTRNMIITALRNANDDDTVFINDHITLDEMETFVQNERSGKFEAQKGCHDDCVISLAIGVYCLNFLTVDESYGAHVKKKHGSPLLISSLMSSPKPIGGHRRKTGM